MPNINLGTASVAIRARDEGPESNREAISRSVASGSDADAIPEPIPEIA